MEIYFNGINSRAGIAVCEKLLHTVWVSTVGTLVVISGGKLETGLPGEQRPTEGPYHGLHSQAHFRWGPRIEFLGTN